MCDIAWLAGVIEGEGTYTLSKWKRDDKSAPKIGVEVKLYNTDALIIRKAMDVLDAHGIGYYIAEREQKPMLRPGGGEYRPTASMLTLCVKTLGSVEKLVSLLEPWTFGEKRARLLLIQRYVELRVRKIAQAGGNYRSVPIDDEDMACVRDFHKLHRRDASTTGCGAPKGEGTV